MILDFYLRIRSQRFHEYPAAADTRVNGSSRPSIRFNALREGTNSWIRHALKHDTPQSHARHTGFYSKRSLTALSSVSTAQEQPRDGATLAGSVFHPCLRKPDEFTGPAGAKAAPAWIDTDMPLRFSTDARNHASFDGPIRRALRRTMRPDRSCVPALRRAVRCLGAWVGMLVGRRAVVYSPNER